MRDKNETKVDGENLDKENVLWEKKMKIKN